MTILKILNYPDPRLRRVAETVVDFGPTLQKVVDDMFETHYSAKDCAALAATQLDLNPAFRITVIDFSKGKDSPLCLINPEIIEASGEIIEQEGCMSIYPEHVHDAVKRAQSITVKAQDRNGKLIEIKADGFMAKCIQHEVDHLNGLTYIDRISPIKRERLLTKIKKAKRIEQANQLEEGSKQSSTRQS